MRRKNERETQVFNQFYNRHISASLSNPRPREKKSSIDKRIDKSFDQMQGYLNREYGENYESCENTENQEEHNNENNEDKEEITHIRFEPVTKTKLEETFAVTTLINGKSKVTPLVRIQYLEWLFGRVFIACVLRHARRAIQINPKCNHKRFAIPAGSAYDDKAPEETPIKKDAKNRPIKKINYK